MRSASYETHGDALELVLRTLVNNQYFPLIRAGFGECLYT